MTEPFFETRVVTRNFIVDFIQNIRNTVGWRQRAYEDMIEETSEELLEEVHDEYDVDWFRVDVDMVSGRAMSVTVYGQGKPK